MKRNGFTLIEILVTLSVGGTMMILGVNIVHQTLKLASEARANCTQLQSSRQITTQFRRDLHAATNAEVASNQQLILEVDDARIVYEAKNGRIRRTQSLSDGKQHLTDLLLLANAQAEFEELANPRRIALTISHDVKLYGVPPRVDRRLEAVVGSQLERADSVPNTNSEETR